MCNLGLLQTDWRKEKDEVSIEEAVIEMESTINVVIEVDEILFYQKGTGKRRREKRERVSPELSTLPCQSGKQGQLTT